MNYFMSKIIPTVTAADNGDKVLNEQRGFMDLST